MSTSGLMMNRPLLISGILEHAAAQFGEQEIVSRETHGPLHRSTFAQVAKRSRQLANALAQMGLKAGSAVGSIAWNNHRHLEAYYAVSGSGMVMHTCNPRLHPQQLIYVINHAEDEVVLFDATFAPLVKGIAAHCPKVRAWVCLADAANTPVIEGVANVMNYEGLITGHSDSFDWPELDDQTGAALCYTSGTTGNPKGVLYTHRAIVLDATTACLPDVLGFSTQETVLPVVPMFHINAWCIPYAALVAGTKLVLPGPKLDGPSLYELMDSEQVTISAGVPTIWMGLIQHVEQNNLRFAHMKRTCGGRLGHAHGADRQVHGQLRRGSAPRLGHDRDHRCGHHEHLDAHRSPQTRRRATRHRGQTGQNAVSGIEIKIVDENGATLPRDGTSQGELMVRGQWIVERYFKAEKTALVDGWFPTGDIATIDAQGTMQIRDRTKDVIKTGGEWISSIDLENAAIGHPAVAMAAVIGVKHPKWDERPLLFIVRKPGQSLEKQEILDFLTTKVAKWWVPDDVVFLESLPVGGTGKVQKNDLRKDYGGVFS